MCGCTFALENGNKAQPQMSDFQLDKDNLEQQLAFEMIEKTNTSLFITGKAGTGKTTFIKGIQEKINKNFLVLAPTGIAALNVGGQTMHSFFGFPFEAMGPKSDLTEIKLSLENKNVLDHINTIIVDEASMVRADLVDAMDRILRSHSKTHLPFGGKQIIFVGDLFQLPPVVKEGSADAELLHNIYGDGKPYFYKAHVLKRISLPKIEFQKVYRQNDKEFLEILDRMRVGENTPKDFATINQRVSEDDRVGDFSVILAAYNKSAESINIMRLEELETEEYCYEGVIDGEFKAQDTPVPIKLNLKVGAQVIFCRNDYVRGVVNGTIAKVTELSDDSIKVVLADGKEINVEQLVWESRESVYNEESGKVESEVVGTFTQYPLKLAWAITIHKSQGMTFDRMHFDLTRGVFATGQAYVAVSRMRSLEGLTLSNSLQRHHIRQDAEVKAFANSFNDLMLINHELELGKRFTSCYNKKDYDGAAKVCLTDAIEKMGRGDYRNAALMMKRMFDVMFNDEYLTDATKGIALLKDCSMTCNFINAVLCLYSGRYDEAIGYADLVLNVRSCLEAMFIKGRALFALGHYEDAFAIHEKIVSISSEAEEKVEIDKKQYLFEARTKQALGKSTIEACRHLVKLCPKYIPAYVMIREEAMANDCQIVMDDDETENVLVDAFNNKELGSADFEKTMEEADKTNATFRVFSKKIRKIEIKDVNL